MNVLVFPLQKILPVWGGIYLTTMLSNLVPLIGHPTLFGHWMSTTIFITLIMCNLNRRTNELERKSIKDNSASIKDNSESIKDNRESIKDSTTPLPVVPSCIPSCIPAPVESISVIPEPQMISHPDQLRESESVCESIDDVEIPFDFEHFNLKKDEDTSITRKRALEEAEEKLYDCLKAKYELKKAANRLDAFDLDSTTHKSDSFKQALQNNQRAELALRDTRERLVDAFGAAHVLGISEKEIVKGLQEKSTTSTTSATSTTSTASTASKSP
jgi:hypothetical protein